MSYNESITIIEISLLLLCLCFLLVFRKQISIQMRAEEENDKSVLFLQVRRQREEEEREDDHLFTTCSVSVASNLDNFTSVQVSDTCKKNVNQCNVVSTDLYCRRKLCSPLHEEHLQVTGICVCVID
jgi:hypothetical protein